MLILSIVDQPRISAPLLAGIGVNVEQVVPSRFSFLTSLRIATAVKHKNPDVVVTYNVNDTIAAISARRLSDRKNDAPPFRIFFYIEHTLTLPRSLPVEIAKQVDMLVFDSQQTLSSWKGLLSRIDSDKIAIISQPGQPAPLSDSTARDTSVPDIKAVLSYVGPIYNGRRLKDILSLTARLPEERQPHIRVLGTAKPRIVMPIVKTSRANKLDIRWLGDDFDIEKELALADGFIASADVPSQNELRLMANAIPEVTPANLNEWLDAEKRAQLGRDARDRFNETFTSDIYVAKVKEIIDKCR